MEFHLRVASLVGKVVAMGFAVLGDDPECRRMAASSSIFANKKKIVSIAAAAGGRPNSGRFSGRERFAVANRSIGRPSIFPPSDLTFYGHAWGRGDPGGP